VDTCKVDGMCAHALKDTCNVEYCANLVGNANPSRIRNIMEKIGEANQKLGKISQIVNQTLALRLEHTRIQA